jgi:hypothetical protein
MRPLNQPPTPESPFRWIKRSIHRSAAAVVVALIVVGCGGGSGAPATVTPTQPGATPAGVPTAASTSAPSAATAAVDACKLLTPAEVSAAYGYTVQAGVATADDLYAYCTYPAADGRDKAMIFVTRSSTAAAYFQTVKVNTGHAVSGVGDEAYWGTGSFLPGLYFLKGGVMAYVSSDSSSSQGPSEASLTELGKLLASRM